MGKFSLGTLRTIEIFDASTKDEVIQHWNNFVKQVVFKGKENSAYSVFGSANDMHPILIELASQHIFIFEPINGSLELVANSPEEFERVLEKVLLIWREYPDAHVIPRDEKVMQKFHEFVADTKSLPAVSLGWWIGFAFNELNIRLRFD